ncbi:MAG: hypothetical protein MJH09_13290 [Cetobacterium sp.]|nr:hypothetical protein [Cetobacterium sp.]
MKKSLYFLSALTLLTTTAFANTEIKEETVNTETEVISTVEVPTSTWSFTGRTYLEFEDFDNNATINRGNKEGVMDKLGSGADGTFWGTGISASKDKLTLDLNVERRYFGDLNSSLGGSKSDTTRVDYKVRYKLLPKQGFHGKYRNDKNNGSRRDRMELGTDFNYFDNLLAGWLVVGHDKDKTYSSYDATGKYTPSKSSTGTYWEGDFGPTFKLSEKLSLNPTLYTTGEFYDSYEMVETQLRIMVPYQVNEKLTVMPRIRLTLDRTQDSKDSNGKWCTDYEQKLGDKIRYELLANYIINENLSTFMGIAYEDGKRDFKNSDRFGKGKNGKEDVSLIWTYVGLNYKF